MKLSLMRCQRSAGVTLIETLVAASIGCAIIGAMVFGSVSFQQLSNGADDYNKATSDQMRVLDSIALDMRRATSGSVSNSGQTLTHRRRGLTGKAIVTLQVALSMLLVVGAGLFVRTLMQLGRTPLGFRC